MAIKKGPKMIDELIRKRASGLGFKTIAADLRISKNTVKVRLKEVGGFEVADALRLLSDGINIKQKIFTPHWSDKIAWPNILAEVEGGTPIKEYWEQLSNSTEQDLHHVPYESFWREFRRRYPSLDVYYHKTHEPGHRCEIDYKGDSPGLGYIERATGEFIECRLFGMVLCNSRMFFPYATVDEKQGSWLSGIRGGFEYFGGVTATLVVDNAKAAVTRVDWFDPDLNREFFNFCNHYGAALIAARPKRPKDKNLIEVHLGVFWRWARRKLRSRQFFSIGELNRYLAEAALEFNKKYQKKYGSSRWERFEGQERKTLKPLPSRGYEFGEWKKAKLHDDCHIQHKYNYYSAPYQHRGKELDVRVTTSHVEVFYQQERVAIHSRRPDSHRGNYCTDKSHLPQRLQAMEELTVARQIVEAEKVGPFAEKIVSTLLTEGSHPHMFLRRTMGILRLKSRYGAGRLERACEVLIQHGSTKPRVREVEKMINSPNLDRRPVALPMNRKPNPHLRGQMSFKTEGENEYGSIEPDGSLLEGIIAERDAGDIKSQNPRGLG